MKKRSQGFFGLHFDFHAGPDCTEIGKDVTEDMVREIIATCQPDYIQCDCKGHGGYSSYPTKVGNPAPGFVKDQLAIWRKVTREHGIPLVVHYSGVWDNRAIELHPEWAAINADGTPNTKMTSTFKGYADGLLIPQLVELANDHGVDAVWMDGECWATVPDFDEKIVAQFEAQNGVKLVRGGAGGHDTRQPAHRRFLDYCRRQFFNYLAHYVDEAHAKARGLEIASNWAFSSHIPRPVCANVDFLSGDFTPVDAYNSARFEARVLCEQGMPWDLMAWGFHHDFSGAESHSVKGAEALCREAAAVLPLGGGFQVYATQNRDGSVRLWEVCELAAVARFAREREPFLKGAEPFSNIGVFYSYHDMCEKSDRLFFQDGNEAARGAVRLLLDAGRTCAVVMDHALTPEGLKGKDLLVLPEINHLRADHKAALLKFAGDGGNLLLSGAACCKAFEDVFDGVVFSGAEDPRLVTFPSNGRGVNLFAKPTGVAVENGAAVAARFLNPGAKPAILHARRGKGAIAALCANFFEVYFHAPDFYARNMVSGVIDSLGVRGPVECKGAGCVDIITARRNGKLLVSLANTSGIYAESKLRAYDEIPSLADLEVHVKTDPPKSVVLQPENKTPPHCYDAAARVLTVKIARLHIHTVVEVAF